MPGRCPLAHAALAPRHGGSCVQLLIELPPEAAPIPQLRPPQYNPIPGDIPGQAGRGSEQPELVKMSLLMAGGALGELGRALQPELFCGLTTEISHQRLSSQPRFP